MTRITNEQRNSVKNLILNGLSVRKIAARLNLSRGTVSNIRRGIKEELLEVKKGRPCKLSDYDKRACVRIITTRQAETAEAVSKILKRDHNIDASRQQLVER